MAAVVALTVTLSACGGSGKNAENTTAGNGTETKAEAKTEAGNPAGEKLKVTLITTASGLGDRSFNDSAWAGVQKAEKELGVEISVMEPTAVSDFGSSIVAAVNGGANIIITFGGAWTDALDEYCSKYPNVYFAGLNCNAEADNLLVARTGDHQGSFLAGALAAMMSESGTIGAVGGQDADNINRFLVGYEEGAMYIKPDVKVLKSYVGSFSDPAKGKEFSQQLMNQGADIIYQVAGGTGEGVFEAAKENEKLFAIGVDSDQDYIVEGKILTSMMKNCDVIAYDVIKMVQDGSFVSGVKVYDLANEGVGLSPMIYTKDMIGEENLARIKEISQKITSGEIMVTDVFEK